jgi:hypothetical protein
MGYSMGGFQLLCLAAQAATNEDSSIKFDRYLSIDSPVNLRYSVTNLDQFYLAPLAWPAPERTSNIENTLLQVAALSEQSPKPGAVLPFNAIESNRLTCRVRQSYGKRSYRVRTIEQKEKLFL